MRARKREKFNEFAEILLLYIRHHFTNAISMSSTDASVTHAKPYFFDVYILLAQNLKSYKRVNGEKKRSCQPGPLKFMWVRSEREFFSRFRILLKNFSTFRILEKWLMRTTIFAQFRRRSFDFLMMEFRTSSKNNWMKPFLSTSNQ